MSKIKYWTEFLPESGLIKYHGEKQVKIINEINIFEEKVNKLKKEYKENEEEIFLIAKKNWKIWEIFEAKKYQKIPFWAESYN